MIRADCTSCGTISPLRYMLNRETLSLLGSIMCAGCAERKLGRPLGQSDWRASPAQVTAGLREALKLLDEAGWSNEATRARLWRLVS